MTHGQWRSALGLDKNTFTFKTEAEYLTFKAKKDLEKKLKGNG